ncbi:MAG: hypothetical protein VYC88_06630, partial [SAR324 cluster bacterium]|nr:hypothetical protein [SAR324 cluster bacterium]
SLVLDDIQKIILFFGDFRRHVMVCGVHCGGGEEWAWWLGFEMVSDWLIVVVFCFVCVCVCVYRRRIIKKMNDYTHSLRKS